MSRVKVTRSYQVTLPKDVREAVGIEVGDYLEVYVDESGRIVMEKVRRERLRLAAGRKLTPEEIDEVIARGLGEAFAGGGD
ncbi:MAG: AbrB/MazE/SpoVT family DNA-binding domain-containing protein [Thermofilaceae archaeon]